MIQHIKWPDPTINEVASPFLRGEHERPLRITFHTSTLVSLPEEERAALVALRGLSHLTEIDALETEVGLLPHFEIGVPRGDPGEIPFIPVTIRYKDGRSGLTGISFPDQLSDLAACLVGQDDREHPNAQAMLKDLLTAQAHHALRRDILITSSSWLLEHRAESFVAEANPRKPSDAAQIVGLFLRSRGNFTYMVTMDGVGESSMNRGLFYWVLTRHRLPSMWRYFSACVAAGSEDLGGSVLTRCARALEARDAIGEQFYIPQNTDTRDRIMYHFDYLTLLLVGTFDALARVARRAYGIGQLTDRDAGFQQEKFPLQRHFLIPAISFP